jgi:dihydrofolate synthase / folylpolyglutamate synthase
MRALSPLQQRLDALLALHPKVIDLSLERIRALLARLGNPHTRLPPVIHVAGTNGKGSTCAFLTAMFEAAGYSVHRYTSPHLVRFNERIMLAGRFVTDEALIAALDRVEAANAGAPITYFEITTAAAFLLFSEVPADVVILEVGLGGRLDATNVIENPVACVITPISMDHVEYLGDTIEKIAMEKAGIIKAGVPVIVGEQPPEVRPVIGKAASEKGGFCRFHKQDWGIEELTDNRFLYWGGLYQNAARQLILRSALVGKHQYHNAGLAIATIAELINSDEKKEWKISSDAIQQGLLATLWPARLQRIESGSLVDLLPQCTHLFLDGSHNPGGAETLADTLADWGSSWGQNQRVHLITGMLGTKDCGGFIAPLVPHVASVHTVPVPRSPAALSPEQLAAAWQAHGITATVCQDVAEALQKLQQTGIAAGETVLITGSLYLAGAVLEANDWRWPGRE